MRRLCATVLVFEAVVVLLAIPVAVTIGHAKPGTAGTVSGVLAGIALLIAGVVGRPRFGWALVAGSVLQAAVIATGVEVTAMYVLGVIFAGLWATAIWLARRYEAP